ncbi:MAG TPA: circularly permuted type 2 ATP-grasp protein [Solirubrobacteraceae bacterium]|nr:circularly permuted type 2 ATP-grasp protein [Solirubrobacteraceae bacterium]
MSGTAIAPERAVLPGAPCAPGEPFEEGPSGRAPVSEQDRLLGGALERLDLTELSAKVAREARRRGVCFGTAEGMQEFRIDPVPRLIAAEEWRALSAGVAQRVRALELFVRDVYGERRIVREGVVPARVIDGADHHEPLLDGIGARIGTWITVAGLDIVRDSDGSFKVLEDNLRTPSGIAYAVATREALRAHLAPPSGVHVRSLDAAFETLGAALRAAAPEGVGDDPAVVLLSDGEGNSALYEHTQIARHTGVPLVLAEQLSVRDGRLYARLPEGKRAVDVVYRRTDEDRLTDERGALTHVAELLLEPVLAGTLAVVNAFGTGVADDKLVHAYVEQMVRFYLQEEPLIGSVPTYDPGDPATLEMVLDRIGELVIKPRSGHGGYGVVIAPHARPKDVRKAAEQLAAAPERFVAQETVMLSRHPTVTDGRLEPRHIDLRPFAIAAGQELRVLPGGLTRVAFDAGALVVNSSQNGGSKDTWVLA